MIPGIKTIKPHKVKAKDKLILSVYQPSRGPRTANISLISILLTDKTVARTFDVVRVLILSFRIGCAIPLIK